MVSRDVDSRYKTKIFWRGSSGEGHNRLPMNIFGYRHLIGPHKIQTHSAHRKDLYLCVCLSFSLITSLVLSVFVINLKTVQSY